MKNKSDYGLVGTTENGFSTNMVSNFEWGAVAYLSHSKYGKNSKVWLNNNWGFIGGYIT